MNSTGTNTARVLSEDEEFLVRSIIDWLKDNNPQELALINERFRLLKNLGNAVFDFPSVKETNYIRDVLLKDHKFTEPLLAFSAASNLLRTPSKVAALRSLLIAKFHTFSHLSNLTEANETLHNQTKDITFTVVFTLMAEDLYFSCLEDPHFSGNTKEKLVDNLIALWDSGTDQRSTRHLMALSSLWAARDSSPPSFGTMDGNIELLRISMDMDIETEWVQFLKEESTNDYMRWALEEFLFGLSYEEILKVRTRLKKFGVYSISHDEVRTYLDSKPVYSAVNEHDPRAIYDFFTERRDACLLRKRIHTPGPYHTLEEIYLKYRIIIDSG